MGEIKPIRSETASSTGLTCIHDRIQCCATQDTNAPEYTEGERVIVDHFLNTLADVALAVAARQGTMKSDDQD